MSELDDFDKKRLDENANALRLDRQKEADSRNMYRQRDEDSQRMYERQAEQAKTVYEEMRILHAQHEAKIANNPAYEDLKHTFTNRDSFNGAYYPNRKRDIDSYEAMHQGLFEKARLEGDKILSDDEKKALKKDSDTFFKQKNASYEAMRTANFDSKLETGSMQVFDKKAAEIVERGNVDISNKFLSSSARLAEAMYITHMERQDSITKDIEQYEKQGKLDHAQVLKDRREYEAVAYERDTGMSYLAKVEAMYGKDSKQFKEQEADVKELSAMADNAHAKLQASQNALNDRVEAQKLEAEQSKQLENELTQQQSAAQVSGQNPSKSDDNKELVKNQQAEAEEVGVERLQNSEANMRQEQNVQEQRNHEANLQKLQELGPLVPSRLEDYEKSKKELDAFLTDEEKIQRAHEEGREISRSEVKGDSYHTEGDAADREAKADARLQQLEQEHQKADAQKPDALKDEKSDQREMKKEDPALDQQRQAEKKAELDKALKEGREGQSQFKQQAQQGIQEREQRQDAVREHFSGRIGELRQAKENLDAKEGRSALQNLKAQDEFNQVANKVSGDLKARENFAKEMIAMKEHGNAMIKADSPAAVKHHTEKFEASYKKLDSLASKAEGNEKGYAADMRHQLDNGIKKLESQEQKVVAEKQQLKDLNQASFTRPSNLKAEQKPQEAKQDQSDVAKKQDVQTASQVNAQKAPDQARTQQDASSSEAKKPDQKVEQGLEKKAEQPAQQEQKPAEKKAEEGNRISGSVQKVQEAKVTKQAEGKSDNQAVEARKAEVERQVKEDKARQAAQAQQQTEDQMRRRR